jgi:hypothetical protein
MSASVRIEDEAFADERYDDLAHFAGLADADHARGKMARIWRQCTIEGTHTIENHLVLRILGEGGIEALIRARLAERISETHVRIRGTRGRIEWLKRLRQNGQKGGRPKGYRNKPSGYQIGKPSGSGELNPPAPAPVTAPTKKEKKDLHPADRALTLKLILKIIANHPGNTLTKLSPAEKDAKVVAWTKHVRLMREQDGHTEQEIGAVIDWCQSDSFWRNQILSTENLRDKWNQLVAKMGAKAPGVARTKTPEQAPLKLVIGGVEVER